MSDEFESLIGLGLTKAQAAIAQAMLGRAVLPFDGFYALSSTGEANAISYPAVMAFGIRKKLGPYGVVIENRARYGYAMPLESKRRLREIMHERASGC